MSGEWTVGIIGGSGFYDLPDLEDAQWIAVESPWGTPSDAVLCGRLGALNIRFLPRHGRGHRLPPDRINARANIDALKRAGCTDIVAFGAVGALDPGIAPGTTVIADQFIDHTHGRDRSFFGAGLVAHVSLAEPVCPRLADALTAAAGRAGARVQAGGTCIVVDGPQFPTRAEASLWHHWGAGIASMTAMPEARLAREAELPYALMGFVTDVHPGLDGRTPLGVEQVVAHGAAGVRLARMVVAGLAAQLPRFREESPIDFALEDAVVTAPAEHDPELRIRLGAVARRLLERL
ncbi:S-methyl-5'-thioadenosine phosphorylase [Erythrobacteraceae bacterium CFH 75059]|uniref:phosphorylase family protein n=1 Tax=Qipengyuania thermophila TaxID=2509361 RepID=UPI00102092A1|nr:S-methyl-5'-thioadenosine phosphorylase [Qipengyuania thermophila]TCD06415.1 S-methyl-5'-thioadenosine phosphorylase [Erythrobacteraceae bacterium CFH 75059]